MEPLENKIMEYVKNISIELKETSQIQKNSQSLKILKLIDFLFTNCITSRLSFTLREVYYILNQKHGFKYAETSKLINRVCSDIKIRRSDLFIFPEPNLFFFGDIVLDNNLNNKNKIIQIPTRYMEYFRNNDFRLGSNICNLIIVEKYSFFESLTQMFKKETSNTKISYTDNQLVGKLCQLENSAFCCGKGFPTISSREFLYKLKENNKSLNIFTLTDGDIHGIKIHNTYQKTLLGCNWIGFDINLYEELFWSNDVDKKIYSDEINALPQLSEKETVMISKELRISKDLIIKKHLMRILEIGKKVELEYLLSGINGRYLVHYIELSIRRRYKNNLIFWDYN